MSSFDIKQKGSKQAYGTKDEKKFTYINGSVINLSSHTANTAEKYGFSVNGSDFFVIQV